jgi:amino acid adenylation domain-containing protein/non-ribosomal peptide synthase protein (TIGR01720 family)
MFDKTMQLIISNPRTPVGNIHILSDTDKEQLWEWNGNVPSAVERCVHDLIYEQAKTQPNALAVHAWDGKLSYCELDKLSTNIAYHLVSLGIKVGEIVPLSFEKSLWTIVALLGVLKAGGAILMLDPKHPESRLRSIISRTGSRVMLSSLTHHHLCSRLVETAIAVGPSTTLTQDNIERRALPSIEPTSAMYVVFTSGSTGVPKGVVVSHRAMATNISYQAAQLGFRSDSKVFDFTSYVFDIFMCDSTVTLATGGCICVPEESERINNLERAISSMEATLVLLTPTVARLIDPPNVPSLKTLILLGEASTLSETERWWPYVSVINAYGPSECSALSVVNSAAQNPTEATYIGKGAGIVTWVVDPADHNRLAAVGTVGELLLEGPLIGLGYLKDPELTAKFFVQAPKWLQEGAASHPGRRGIVYKTGDLVKYNADGSLVYLGRKDTQVKIRGQRVELGEVEHQVYECLPASYQAQQVIAEVVVPTGAGPSPLLAAFVATGQESTLDDGNLALGILPFASEIEERLSDRLPIFMVPTLYFTLPRLPMTATGKTDRRMLRELVASLSVQELTDLRGKFAGQKRMPSTNIERDLQSLWARVLNIDPATVGIDDSFFRLGGDSITAMQISSAARTLQLRISTSDILRKKTIARLASSARSLQSPISSRVRALDDPVDKPFGLTPIQALYLHLQGETTGSFDQCFFLGLRERVPFETLSEAFATVVQRHSMLRARFHRDRVGIWEQTISEDPKASFHLLQAEPKTAAEMVQVMTECRAQVNVVTGPTVAAVYLVSGKEQSLFIAVHHLVIDLVSWRILLQDLETLLLSQPLPVQASLPFHAWREVQAKYITEHVDPSKAISFDLRPSMLSYWGLDSTADLSGHTITEEFVLDQAATALLLGRCNDAFKTRPFELMIAGLISAFGAAFPDRPCPPVFNETHGRETWSDEIDLSQTVGWFTSMFPIQLASSTPASLSAIIRETKDCARCFLDKSWAYFPSRFVDEKAAESFMATFPTEIVFNYLGVYQQLERTDSFFKNLPMPQGDSSAASAPPTKRFSLFEVGVVVEEGCAHFSVTYDRAMDQDKATALIREYRATMTNMSGLLTNRAPEWTLSDFPLMFKTYAELEEFTNSTLPRLAIQPADVEDVFPCSPMQQGILASQSKDTTSYRVSTNLRVAAAEGGPVDCARLQEAWKQVVRRHSLLRAVLTDNMPGSSGVAHIVLRDPQPDILVFQAADESVSRERFQALYDPTTQQQLGRLQHHLAICQLGDGSVSICLNINHAIMDAHARDLIFHDFQRAYTGDLDLSSPSFRNVIAYFEQQPDGEPRSYWAEFLKDAEPCLFPSLSEKADQDCRERTVPVPGLDARSMRLFCQEWEVTVPTVIQLAWASVLSAYTGSLAPCFGNLTSGRDLAIDRVTDIVGPLVNMFTCRVPIKGSQTILEAVRSVQDNYVRSQPYQSFPLLDVHKLLGLDQSALFNTAMSVQRVDAGESTETAALLIESQDGRDPTEVCLVYNVQAM